MLRTIFTYFQQTPSDEASAIKSVFRNTEPSKYQQDKEFRSIDWTRYVVFRKDGILIVKFNPDY